MRTKSNVLPRNALKRFEMLCCEKPTASFIPGRNNDPLLQSPAKFCIILSTFAEESRDLLLLRVHPRIKTASVKSCSKRFSMKLTMMNPTPPATDQPANPTAKTIPESPSPILL
jgi:hypothetical protein